MELSLEAMSPTADLQASHSCSEAMSPCSEAMSPCSEAMSPCSERASPSSEVLCCIFSFMGTFLGRKVCSEFRRVLRPSSGEEFVKMCFAQGNLEMIKRLRSLSEPLPFLQRFVREALLTCQEHILDYLEEQGYEWDELDFIDLCSGSDKSGQRLEFMQKRRVEYSGEVLRGALVHGHVNIYLHYKKSEFGADLGLITEKGHLALVRQIYLSLDEESKEKFASFVEMGAARNERGKEILCWLYSLRGKLSYAHREYAFLGNLELFLWSLQKGCLLDVDCLVCAFCGDNLDIIKYVVENNPNLPIEDNMYILVENNQIDALNYLHQRGYRLSRNSFSSVGIEVLEWLEKREYKLEPDMFNNSFFLETKPVETLTWLLKRDLISLNSSLYEDAFLLNSYEYFLYLKEHEVPLKEVNLLFICGLSNLDMFKQALEMAQSVTHCEDALGSLVLRENTAFLEILLLGEYKEWREHVYKMALDMSPDVAYWLKKKGYAE
nr:hypothetical protein Cplu_504 [Cedratvirus plubellavi]